MQWTWQRSFSRRIGSRDSAVLTDFHDIPLSDDQMSFRSRLTRLSNEMLESKKVGIRCISRFGFRLIDGTFVFGPVAVFPMTVLSWRVPTPAHITEESVEFFTLLEPKIDVLIIGAGGRMNVDSVRKRISRFLIKSKIGFEVMDTEEAVSTFNFLNGEHRCVAGALFPPPDLVVGSLEHGRAMELLKSYDELDIHPLLGGLESTLSIKKDIIKKLWGQDELKSLDVVENLWKFPKLGSGQPLKGITPKENNKK